MELFIYCGFIPRYQSLCRKRHREGRREVWFYESQGCGTGYFNRFDLFIHQIFKYCLHWIHWGSIWDSPWYVSCALSTVDSILSLPFNFLLRQLQPLRCTFCTPTGSSYSTPLPLNPTSLFSEMWQFSRSSSFYIRWFHVINKRMINKSNFSSPLTTESLDSRLNFFDWGRLRVLSSGPLQS